MSGVVTVSRALTPRNWTAAVDPTNGDDAADGVRVGDHWFNTATGNVFVCVTNTVAGAVWRHIPRILAASGAALSHTGNTNETGLVTVSVPAGAMGVNGILRVRTVWTVTNNANNKTRRIRFGAAAAGTGGTVMLGVASASTASIQHLNQIQNRNSTSSQVAMSTGAGTGGFTETTSANATGSINTANASEVFISGQLATGTDTITLESYSVELLRPDIT